MCLVGTILRMSETRQIERSQSANAELTCPSCGKPFTAEVWLVVDRQERPDLVDAIMQGELNVAACPHCGAEGGVNHPLLLHDAQRRQVTVAMPLTVRGEAAARELVGELLGRLLAAVSAADHEPYMGQVELVPELDGLRALLIEQALADQQGAREQLTALAVQDLLNVADQADFEHVIAQHRGLLLGDRAEQVLDEALLEARRAGDGELRVRAREARALLGRLRNVLSARRAGLARLLDELAPLSDGELEVLPELRRMLDAIEPQDVYAARIDLSPARHAAVDGLVERLAERAAAANEAELLSFLRALADLPRQ